MSPTNRIERIINLINENNITAYEISQNTRLTINGIQKIIDGKTSKPRESTIDEIEEFVNKKILEKDTTGVQQNKQNISSDLLDLSKKCTEHWDQLMEVDSFKTRFYLQLTKTLNMDIDEIFSNVLNKNS